MLGIILYIYILILGFLYAELLFKKKDIYFRAWMGGIFGNVLLMSGIAPFAAIFGFNELAHIIFAVVAVIPYIIIKLKTKRPIFSGIKGEESGMSNKIFLFLILPLALVTWVLMTNHILAPHPDGGVSSGQCTYGDLHMHLSFVTSIAEQGKFPPDYPLLAGEVLNYPFFIDMLSSSLYLFGLPLRWAVLIPSYVVSLGVFMGFYILAYRITKKKSAAVLACVLFFLNGGFGFAYFFDGMKGDFSNFTRIFTEYYETPANLIEENVRWVNTICDMIIPQRTTMAGWCIFFATVHLLLDALKENKKSLYIILAVIAGCMPMIHTHSFLALGMISAVMFFAYFSKDKAYIVNWVTYGAIVFVLAVPQLLIWTFAQTGGTESFLSLSFNWANENDTYFWFYLKNWGIIALFAIPAVMNSSKENKKLALCGLFILVLSEIILFQPNKYDNNKLIFVTYMILAILVGDYLLYLYNRLSDIKGRNFFAVVILVAATLSGVLTIGREYVSGRQYRTFSDEDIAFGEYVRDNTEKDAIILTGQEVTNPVAVFGGRTIYIGGKTYIHFYGFGKENTIRGAQLKKAYTGDYETTKKFCIDNNISYIYVGASERAEYKINEEMLSKFKKVYTKGNNSLYKVK